MSLKYEFQAIIMAAGQGSKLNQLTTYIPKPLLPISNKPMIMYPISMLEKAGFEEAIIVVQCGQLEEIKKVLEVLHPVQLSLDFFTLPDDVELEDFGTADTLRMLQDKIKKDVIILPCDLISSMSLCQVARLHRVEEASFTMLVAKSPNFSEAPVPKLKSQQKIEKDLIGLAGDNNDRVVIATSEFNLEGFLNFNVANLKKTPSINLHTDLIDCHVYFFKRRVLSLLFNDGKFSRLKNDFIPHLLLLSYNNNNNNNNQTNNQDNPKDNVGNSQSGKNRSEDNSPQNTSSDEKSSPNYDYLIKKTSLNIARHTDEYDLSEEGFDLYSAATSCNRRERIICRAFVVDQKAGCRLLRANTLPSYCLANKMMCQEAIGQQDTSVPKSYKPSQVSYDCFLGDGVIIGDKSRIKGCILGDKCVVKDNCKLIDCIVMDHVTIESGVNLTKCLLSRNVQVSMNCSLKDCLVGYNQTVTEGKYTNEEFLNLDQMMVL